MTVTITQIVEWIARIAPAGFILLAIGTVVASSLSAWYFTRKSQATEIKNRYLLLRLSTLNATEINKENIKEIEDFLLIYKQLEANSNISEDKKNKEDESENLLKNIVKAGEYLTNYSQTEGISKAVKQ